jgi:hypothetical protein
MAYQAEYQAQLPWLTCSDRTLPRRGDLTEELVTRNGTIPRLLLYSVRLDSRYNSPRTNDHIIRELEVIENVPQKNMQVMICAFDSVK